MSELFDGFLDDYFAECDEHLTSVRGGLLALEASVGRNRPDPAVTEELFRSFHSLKGLCGMVEHRESELLAHEMESYLRALRDGDTHLTTAGLETLIDGARALERAIGARRQRADVPDTTPVLNSLRALTSHPAPEAASEPWECLFTPSPALIARGINVDLVRKRLREVGGIIRATPLITDTGAVAFRFVFTGNPEPATRAAWEADGMVCTQSLANPVVSEPELQPVLAPVEEQQGATLSSGHYVRVDLARLDQLMRMIGDLVILRARLGDSIQRVEPHVPPADWRAIQENTTAIERQLRELREGVMRVRLVPVGEIFRRMPFVVRDLTRDSDRKVKVELSGQDTEIDKFLVERMMDPVIHLVRNAVSHGIESVDERIAAGKPPEGTISLNASAAGEIVTIEIADDGRGVDADRVVARARSHGLAVPSGLVDEVALLDLICSPGFSTREETDRISGRGIGMSVVRSTVLELGGEMRLVSAPGHGTRFVIDLPLTLAITDALIARVGTQTFALPQASVREVIEVDPSTIRTLQDGDIVPYRGAALPIVRLSAVLGIKTAPAARFHAFIVGSGPSAVGLLVDRILGQREIVVRSALDPLIRVNGVSGATDLGDGRAVLILDAAAIARGASGRGLHTPAVPTKEIA